MVAALGQLTAGSLDASSRAVDFHGLLYFTANDGHGGGLFRSNGTAAGTQVVHHFAAWNPAVPHEVVVSHGSLFFNGDDGTEARGLWKSDGTAAGTMLLKDIHFGLTLAGAEPVVFPDLTDVNGTLYFSATPQGTDGGAVLWKSDGTTAGTVLLKVFRGNFTGGPTTSGWPTPVGGTLYFTGYDDAHGIELWRSDGTPAGTVMVQDINPGSGGSYPQQLLNANGTLFFTADDGAHGPELWKLGPSATGVGVRGQEGQGCRPWWRPSRMPTSRSGRPPTRQPSPGGTAIPRQAQSRRRATAFTPSPAPTPTPRRAPTS